MERFVKLSHDKEEQMGQEIESRLKKARNMSELLHGAFLVEAARTLKKQGLQGRVNSISVCARGQKRGQEYRRRSTGGKGIRSHCGPWIR